MVFADYISHFVLFAVVLFIAGDICNNSECIIVAMQYTRRSEPIEEQEVEQSWTEKLNLQIKSESNVSSH